MQLNTGELLGSAHLEFVIRLDPATVVGYCVHRVEDRTLTADRLAHRCTNCGDVWLLGVAPHPKLIIQRHG